MLLISIDSSSNACSAAVLRDGAVLAEGREAMERGHAAALPVMIESLLRAAACPPQSLDAVAVSIGPGSFTGLRIGLAAAKGLALAIDRPLVGVTCFAALTARIRARDAAGAKAKDAVLLALESRRADLFVQAYDKAGTILLPDQALAAPGVCAALTPLLAPGARLLIEGDAAPTVAEAFAALSSPDRRPVVILEDGRGVDALDVGRAAAVLLCDSPAHEGGYRPGLAPYYLRPPDVSIAGSGAGSGP